MFEFIVDDDNVRRVVKKMNDCEIPEKNPFINELSKDEESLGGKFSKLDCSHQSKIDHLVMTLI